MNSMKLILLAGSAIAVLGSTAGASAGTIYGGGSSLASLYIRQAGNCYAAKETLMNAAGVTAPVALPITTPPATVTVPEFTYKVAGATVFDCVTTNGPEPTGNISYISTGSGRGLDGFLSHDGQVFGPNSNFPSAGSAITFAASDTPLKIDETNAYNNGGTTTVTDIITNAPLVVPAPGLAANYGALIQAPIFVAPVAIAYNPVYSGTFKLRVKTPNVTTSGLIAVGGLPMTKALYCGIFNGTINNWNNAAFTAANGGVSLKDPTDPTPVGSWSAPITKIFGRSDGSGTTTIFTRHLAAVCGAAPANNYTTASGTSKFPAAAIAALGSSLSLASGNGSVKTGIEATAGSLGFIGAEFLAPFNPNGSALNAANLQIAAGAKFAKVGIADATAGFNAAGLPVPTAATKADPLAWVPTNLNSSIANPSAGYPIVGTTNVLAYTCYADPTNAQTLKGFLQVVYGVKSTVKYGTPAFPATQIPNFTKIWTDPKTGIVALSGLAAMPTAWQVAANNTFLLDPTVEQTAAKPATLIISGVTATGKSSPGIGVANRACLGKTGA